MNRWKEYPSLNLYVMAYSKGSVVQEFSRSPLIVIYLFIATSILFLFVFPSSDQYIIACPFMMKAMEDQVVQEELGYQDDEVNLWFTEKYMCGKCYLKVF